MAATAPATPLLLTKRINAFLNANQSPQLPTLLLTTAHGKLLAHASSQSVSVLRTHGTVAASLLSIHTSSSVALPSALPGSATPDPISSSPPPPSSHARGTNDDTENDNDKDDDEATARGTDDEADQQQQQQQQATNQNKTTNATPTTVKQRKPSHDSVKPVTITVQLSGGTLVVRRLKCGLLFVCVGPSAHDVNQPHPTTTRTADTTSTSSENGNNNNNTTTSNHNNNSYNNGGGGGSGGATVTASSDAESLMSAQTSTSLDSAIATSVVAMRKHANELARWLDEKLGSLTVPRDGTIVE